MRCERLRFGFCIVIAVKASEHFVSVHIFGQPQFYDVMVFSFRNGNTAIEKFVLLKLFVTMD